jgi:hypothetical protein
MAAMTALFLGAAPALAGAVALVVALGLPAIGMAAGPDLGSQDSIEGTARDGKGRALLETSSGAVWTVQGIEEWPDGVSGQPVVVTGSQTRAHVLPVATQGPDGGWSQGVAAGSGPDSVLQSTAWKRRPPVAGPWVVRITDGNGNRTTLTRSGGTYTWTYAPVQPAESSSGTYSGGAPGDGAASLAALKEVWIAVGQAQANRAAHADQRAMGTVEIVIEGAAGATGVLLGPGETANTVLAAVAATRAE